MSARIPEKAGDFIDRFREIVSDPINLLIERVPMAGARGGNLVTLHNGARVPLTGDGVYYGDFSQILVINRGVHEPLEEYVFQECLRNLPDAPVMLELGAYWGHYSMWMKIAHPDATVFLVEPDAANMKAGQDNFERNELKGNFHRAEVGANGFKVDDFMIRDRAFGIDRLDVLHADIQGAELWMLDGAATSLKFQAIRHLFISTHSDAIHDGVVERLLGHGYRIDVSSSVTDTTACDGLVVASRHDEPMMFLGPALGRQAICNATTDDLLFYLDRQATGR